jgi:hypothetical protein
LSGPIWRFDEELTATCDFCFREMTGLFIEGKVADDAFAPGRRICSDCYRRWNRLVIRGEVGGRAPAPAYARR